MGLQYVPRFCHAAFAFRLTREQRRRPSAEGTAAMPCKSSHEDGVKGKGRSKSEKARRSFELHGQYSSKHLRLKESAREAKCLHAREVK